MPIISFKQTSVENREKTINAGRLVFDEGVEATIHIDEKTSVKRVWLSDGAVDDEIRLYWMPEYLTWKDGREHVEGTSVSMLPMISPAQVANLKSCGIASIEQLAAASATQIESAGMGTLSLKQSAMAFLDSKNGETGNTVARLTDENEMLKYELAEMRAQLALQAEAAKADQDSEEPRKKKA